MRVLFRYNIQPLTQAFTLKLPFGFEPIAVVEQTGVFGGTFELIVLVDPKEKRWEKVDFYVTPIGVEFDMGRKGRVLEQDGNMVYDPGTELYFVGMMGTNAALWMRHHDGPDAQGEG